MIINFNPRQKRGSKYYTNEKIFHLKKITADHLRQRKWIELIFFCVSDPKHSHSGCYRSGYIISLSTFNLAKKDIWWCQNLKARMVQLLIVNLYREDSVSASHMLFGNKLFMLFKWCAWLCTINITSNLVIFLNTFCHNKTLFSILKIRYW